MRGKRLRYYCIVCGKDSLCKSEILVHMRSHSRARLARFNLDRVVLPTVEPQFTYMLSCKNLTLKFPASAIEGHDCGDRRCSDTGYRLIEAIRAYKLKE